MSDYKYIVRYSGYDDKIIFPSRIASGILPDFAAAIKIWHQRNHNGILTLDFSAVEKAFANGMLGIIAITTELRRQGIQLRIWLPRLKTANTFFYTTSWIHLLVLDSKVDRQESDKHFVQQFQSFEEIPEVIAHFMEIVMGHIQMPKDILAALE